MINPHRDTMEHDFPRLSTMNKFPLTLAPACRQAGTRGERSYEKRKGRGDLRVVLRKSMRQEIIR
jgi:hypothetical protein